jgi:hypothetical protein
MMILRGARRQPGDRFPGLGHPQFRDIARRDELRGELFRGEHGEPERRGLAWVRLQPPGGELGDGRLLHPRRPGRQPPPRGHQAEQLVIGQPGQDAGIAGPVGEGGQC